MRNYVSKVLVGSGLANANTTDDVQPEDLTEGQIIVLDADTGDGLVAGSKNIQFALGTAVLGEPVLSAVIAKSGIESYNTNAYQAAQKKKQTLTVSAVPTAGETVVFKAIYHDNHSIIPNQIKQTAVSVTCALSGETTTTFAAKIAAAFNLQEFKFVAVTSAAAVVTFEGIVLTSESSYNSIDRPESVNFEVNAPTGEKSGTYAVATTVALRLGQGSPAKIAWMEEQAQGRRGFSDRRMWNDTKKFQSSADAGSTYDVGVISAQDLVAGEMQGVRSNPIGVIIAAKVGTIAAINTNLATAGISPVVIPPSS